MLTPGYFQDTIWAKGYWQTSEQYWGEFGVAAEPPVEEDVGNRRKVYATRLAPPVDDDDVLVAWIANTEG